MRSMLKVLGISAALAALVATATPAQAAPFVYVDPSSVVVNTSLTTDVSLDILVDPDGWTLGGYSFDLTWDVAVMDWTLIDYDPDGNFANAVDFSSPGPLDPAGSPGIISAFIAGDPAGDNDGTNSPLRLMHIDFVGAGALGFEGTTLVDLLNVHLSNALGEPTDIPGVTAEGGIVCFARLGSPATIEPPACEREVPEPMLMSLLVAGLAGAGIRRRASKRS